MRLTIVILACTLALGLLYGGKLFNYAQISQSLSTIPNARSIALDTQAIQTTIVTPRLVIRKTAAQVVLTAVPLVSSVYTTTPTPTALPTSTPSPSPSTSHLFSTSSHWKAKYYYCDTDKDRLALSKEYLKVFASVAELLQSYPSRIPHQPCK